jgi:uncharacterized membrane protein YhaH (DUF805 family)
MDDDNGAVRGSRSSGAQPHSVSAAGALKSFWAKAFTYSGRSTPAEYNWPLVTFLVASCAAGALFEYLIPRTISSILAIALFVVFMVPWFALIARRCHDMNRPGSFGLLLLATGLGFLVVEGLLMFSGSDSRGVRFDPAIPLSD